MANFLTQLPLLTITLILALIIGSFLNMVIYRLPLMINNDKFETAKTKKKISLTHPYRSFCPCCKKQIRLIHLIPIIGFLVQKGKCEHCQKPIAKRYLLVEITSAILSIIIVYKAGISIETFYYLLLVYGLIVLFWIDIDHHLLPDVITIPLLWFGLVYHINYGVSLTDSVIGALVGYLTLWSLYWLFKLVRNKEVMGYGDFKLTAALGAWLGWQLLPMLLLISASMAILFFIFKKMNKNEPLAFGPFLIISALVLIIGAL